jgi:hypothetical protein
MVMIASKQRHYQQQQKKKQDNGIGNAREGVMGACVSAPKFRVMSDGGCDGHFSHNVTPLPSRRSVRGRPRVS